MSKKIVAFGASSSRNSINKKLATWAANQIDGATVNLLDLNDFEMPIYSIDREQESGIPAAAQNFKTQIQSADALVVSFAEHNGSYSTAFKNILDWISRIEKSIWLDKPMFLLATSPGGRGGQTVLDLAKATFPFQGAKVIASFSLPAFQKNFSPDSGIQDEELKQAFEAQLALFAAS